MDGNKKAMINMENEKIFELIEKMYADLKGDINSLKSGQDDLSSRLSNVETEVKKNSILLEKVDSNVQLLAEGQESFRNQIGRNNNDDKRSINDRLDVIELAVTSTSQSVSDINNTVDVLKNTTANNDLDIKILKKQRKSAL